MHDDLSPNTGVPDLGALAMPMHRVVMTVSIPLSAETRAKDTQDAWRIMTTPESRLTIARRLTRVDPEILAQRMDINGVVEQLDQQTGEPLPTDATYVPPEEEL